MRWGIQAGRLFGRNRPTTRHDCQGRCLARRFLWSHYRLAENRAAIACLTCNEGFIISGEASPALFGFPRRPESRVSERFPPRETARAVRIAEDTGSARDRLWVFAGGDELCRIRHNVLPTLRTVLPAKDPAVFVMDLRQTEMSGFCEQHNDSDIRRVVVDDDTCEMSCRRLHRLPASRRA
jgi:hypothetical protein